MSADAPTLPRDEVVSASRRGEVLAELDRIHDPCSVSIGRPIGLVGMGIIDRVDVVGAVVSIAVLPTFPDCMFRGVFEEEIETRIGALSWCEEISVAFCPADRSWDESRMTRAALQSLGRKTGRVKPGSTPTR